MLSFLGFLENFLNSSELLLIIMLTALAIKTYVVKMLVMRALATNTILKPWFFLIGILIGSIVGDVTWIIKLARTLFIPTMGYSIMTFFIRIAWAFLLIQYQSIALFVASLTQKKYTFPLIQKILCTTTFLIICYFIYIAFFESNLTDEITRNIAYANPTASDAPFEVKIMQYTVFYWLNLLILPALVFAIRHVRKALIPKILKKQLIVLIQYLIIPFMITELILAVHFTFISLHVHTNVIMGLSTILSISTIYYCINRVMGLRFLNFNKHVQTHHHFNFIGGFKEILEGLSHATSIAELTHITKLFFNDAFGIQLRKTSLLVRSHPKFEYHHRQPTKTQTYIEDMLNCNPCLYEVLGKKKILIYDELEFSNFYQENETRTLLIQFLKTIQADIFIPVFDKSKIIGSITVEINARGNELYGNIERDKMIVFASYLGNIINLLQNRSLEVLIKQKKEITQELFQKQQEINQYKESIRSFIKKRTYKNIGIIFFKNRRFVFANKAAKELISININTQDGHPLTKTLKNMARQVDRFKVPQTSFATDVHGNSLVLSAVPNLENNNVIITIYYPEISDIVKKQIDLLKDPSKWDYLLYLETTKSGQLINQAIPGSGETLLNFKIDLLKTALDNKATLLTLPEEDLITLVDLLHHISLRRTLHTIKLEKFVTNHDILILLFGINPLFGLHKQGKPLLEKLDDSGTLFIKNIHYLDLQTQDYLAEFIKYGFFKVYKSDRTISSNVRIICSTTQDLHAMVQEGTFSSALFHELKKASIFMPSLSTLPEPELNELAEGFTAQVIKTTEFKNLLELTDKEKTKISRMRPVSLKELKTKIQQILAAKSKENQIHHEMQFDPAFEITDPELLQAAQLGKQALRDPKIMMLLWNKFNKNQNKIATFLGVNRSSVNRRCKEHNLQ